MESAGGLTRQTATVKTLEDRLADAKAFLAQHDAEVGLGDAVGPRLAAIRQEIEQTGTYVHTPQELAFGARVAWRNNSRCIGRLYWEMLQVRDRRDLQTTDDIFEALVDHIRLATNGGQL